MLSGLGHVIRNKRLVVFRESVDAKAANCVAGGTNQGLKSAHRGINRLGLVQAAIIALILEPAERVAARHPIIGDNLDGVVGYSGSEPSQYQ